MRVRVARNGTGSRMAVALILVPEEQEHSVERPHPVERLVARCSAARPRAGHIVAKAEQLLLDRYVPACMVVTRKGDIVHVQGPTHEYLLRSASPHTHNVFAQACDALRATLQAAVRKAIRDESPVTVPASVGNGEESRRVTSPPSASKNRR